MNYRLIQHYANKFPPEIREDIFQDGCVAILEENNIYSYMVDKYRWWTKYRRRNPENAWKYELSENLKYEFDPCEEIYIKEMLPKINVVLSKLKPRWKQILHLRYWKGMKLREIGDQFGVSESAVSILHKKILEVLRLRLDEKPNPRACSGQGRNHGAIAPATSGTGDYQDPHQAAGKKGA